MSIYFFLHQPSGRSWPTDDPHNWLLGHRDDGLLDVARERLVLSPDDPERCLRVVLRRCSLVLVQVVDNSRIVVRYWTEPAPNLRQWAKEHRLARSGVTVTLLNEKTGHAVVHQDGADVLLHGVRVGGTFPWDEFCERYERRSVEEPDDQDAAPAAWTNLGWAGVPPGRITWAVLKSVWRSERRACPNCDRPLLVTGFSWNRSLLSFRSGRVARHCLRCQRRFEADEENPLGWLSSVLESHLRPTHLTLWRRFEIEWPDQAPRLR